jgi:hypothetical protein
MGDLSAERTLVKSPPELWSERSELERLAKHLDAFGEIRITKLQPEREVAWEAERAAGTISLEPSGWGTKVTLTAELEDEAGPADEEQENATATTSELDLEKQSGELAGPSTSRTARWMDRVFPGWRAPDYQHPLSAPSEESPVDPTPADEQQEPIAAPEPAAPDEAGAREVLDSVLDTLGAAHHRPFSRG